MKLRHNDLIQIRKAGLKEVTAKIAEVTTLITAANKEGLSHNPKNPKSARALRRSLAQLHTMATELKEVA